MDTTSARDRGAIGEAIAALFLTARGYAVLARNLRVNRSEIDLVVERGRLLVAVEVKWRRADAGYGAATEGWRVAQRWRARNAILGALSVFPDAGRRPWRCDLVTIEEHADGIRLTHHAGAWSPGDSYW